MTHDDPYSQRESDAADEDLRQRRAEEADEFANEVRQLRKAEYWWACGAVHDHEDEDAAYEPGDPKRSDFLDGED